MAATHKRRAKRKSVSSYEADIAIWRKKKASAALRLQKAKEKEIKRIIAIANESGIFNYAITDDEIRAVFSELSRKKVSTERDSLVFSKQQKFNRIKLKLSTMTTQHRKADAHSKISLGGLIVKAGMRDTDPALLLGALMEVAKSIEQGDDKEKLKAWRVAGKMALAKNT